MALLYDRIAQSYAHPCFEDWLLNIIAIEAGGDGCGFFLGILLTMRGNCCQSRPVRMATALVGQLRQRASFATWHWFSYWMVCISEVRYNSSFVATALYIIDYYSRVLIAIYSKINLDKTLKAIHQRSVFQDACQWPKICWVPFFHSSSFVSFFSIFLPAGCVVFGFYWRSIIAVCMLWYFNWETAGLLMLDTNLLVGIDGCV